MASGPTSHSSGVLNARGGDGSVLRRIITPIATTRKANNVPALDTSASRSTGKQAANAATNTPVMMVTTCGVKNFGCTVENILGIRPSRDMVNNTRVWPNIIIRMTDGSAMTAEAATA